MSTNQHFEEDDLILYAMRLLPEPEQSAVSEWIAASPEAQRRLAQVQSVLGAYAEASVELRPAPVGSLDRLMSRIAKQPSFAVASGVAPEKNLRTLPTVSSTAQRSSLRRPAGLWVGWAIAATLALATGATAYRLVEAQRTLSARDAEVAGLSNDASVLRRQGEQLQASLAEERAREANISGEAQSAQTEAQIAHGAANAAETGAAKLQSALAGKSQEVQEQSARAQEAERERNQLQGTIAQQQEQLAEASSATQDAQVLAALTDPTALRVVLTKPKSKPAPTGRAAYVANKGTLVFLVSHMPTLRPNKVYELWLLPASGANPVAAGTFVPDADGNAHLTYAHFPQAVPAKGFAVTVENTGGAQAPTLPLLLTGS